MFFLYLVEDIIKFISYLREIWGQIMEHSHELEYSDVNNTKNTIQSKEGNSNQNLKYSLDKSFSECPLEKSKPNDCNTSNEIFGVPCAQIEPYIKITTNNPLRLTSDDQKYISLNPESQRDFELNPHFSGHITEKKSLPSNNFASNAMKHSSDSFEFQSHGLQKSSKTTDISESEEVPNPMKKKKTHQSKY